MSNYPFYDVLDGELFLYRNRNMSSFQLGVVARSHGVEEKRGDHFLNLGKMVRVYTGPRCEVTILNNICLPIDKSTPFDGLFIRGEDVVKDYLQEHQYTDEDIEKIFGVLV